MKADNPESFRLENNEKVQRSTNKKKAADPESFSLENNEAVQRTQNKKKDTDLETFNQRNLEAKRKSKLKSDANVDERERIMNFKKATLFGPIFICSCCKRRLFENGVIKIKANFQTKIETKQPGLYEKCIRRHVLIEVKVNGSDRKTGNYNM